ncbi:MAG: SWIM zinc finger family protein [Acidimicrobiia bacterium]
MAETTPVPQPDVAGRWHPEHVLALARDAAGAASARRVAIAHLWSGLGCDTIGIWGSFQGSGAEPYQTVVDVREPAARCTCPSRRSPCKHGVGLMLLWAMELVPAGQPRPVFAATWLSRRPERPAGGDAARREADPDVEPPDAASPVPMRPRPGRPDGSDGGFDERPGPADKRAAERAARVAAGLSELDRWLADVVRGGLAQPALARYGPWEQVVARLVDAQAPSLANRVRRLAGAVGVGPGWHQHVLAELGVLHLVAVAGRRLQHLEPDLADSVRSTLGWTVRQADVLARAPETDRWFVAGRSDVLEDRIVVRRSWLRGAASRDWALVLSFAAYGQSLDGALPVGAVLSADLHRYPGRDELRCVLGAVHAAPEAQPDEPVTTSLAGACDEIGARLAAVPWLERWPVTVAAAPTLAGGAWSLVDHTGTVPLAPEQSAAATIAALSGGRAVPITAEWTAAGFVPLTVHLPDRSVDIGPRGGFHERRWGRAS